MAKNSIEIKLESTSSKETKDAPAIKKSEEKAPVQAVSATEKQIENVAKTAESVMTTAEQELKDRATEAREQVQQSPVVSAVAATSPVQGTAEQKDWFEGFAEADTGQTIKHPSKPEFPVGPEGHQWEMRGKPGTTDFHRQPLMSFRGHEGDRTDDPEKSSTSSIVRAMREMDRGKEEDPLSDISTDRTKVEGVLGKIDENTDELESLTAADLKSSAAQAMAALDKGQSRGPKALGSEDVIESIRAGDSGGPGTGPRGMLGAEDPEDAPTEKLKGLTAAAGPLLGKLGKFGIAIAGVTKVTSVLIQGFQKLDSFLVKAGEEIQAFAPDIIVEKVNRTMMLLEKRMERADAVGSQLADYEKSRTRLLEAVEEFKTKFIKVMLPLAKVIMDFLGKIVEAILKIGTWVRVSLLSIEELILQTKVAFHVADAADKARILVIQAELRAINANTKKKTDIAWDHMDRVLTLLTGQGTNVPGFTRVPGSIASGI